jgi:hypothetical protein
MRQEDMSERIFDAIIRQIDSGFLHANFGSFVETVNGAIKNGVELVGAPFTFVESGQRYAVQAIRKPVAVASSGPAPVIHAEPEERIDTLARVIGLAIDRIDKLENPDITGKGLLGGAKKVRLKPFIYSVILMVPASISIFLMTLTMLRLFSLYYLLFR